MARQAHGEGIAIRAIVLASDVVDFPGNSVITEKLLEKVDSPEKFRTLFKGMKLESSYGALPSQNSNTGFEKDTERIKVYKNIGDFIKKGKLILSSAPSNIPSLRKLNSLTGLAPELVTISKNSQKIEVNDFSESVEALTIRARHAQRDNDQRLVGYEIFSDEEKTPEDEKAKYSVLDAEYRRELLEKYEAQKKKLERKIIYLQESLGGAKGKRR